MAQFRAKRLDLSCFVNIRTIRDHTKRKVFEQYETERYTLRFSDQVWVCNADLEIPVQTGSSLYHPQYHFTATNTRSSPTSAIANACIHTAYADTQSVYRRREGKGCLWRFSYGTGRHIEYGNILLAILIGFIVPFPNERFGWEPPGREEG